jgi:autotransporter translocation and assembly factor TamB
MQTINDKTTTNKPKRKRIILKILLAVSALIAAIIVSAVVFLPDFISSKKGNRFILEQINKRIDGNVNFESLSMSWKKGVAISGLTFRDKAGNISANVKRIQTQPHYLSLLSEAPFIGEISTGCRKIRRA